MTQKMKLVPFGSWGLLWNIAGLLLIKCYMSHKFRFNVLELVCFPVTKI